MKILKEDFIQETPIVIINQLPKGTQCIFEHMSVAGVATELLSELGRPISKIELINYDNSTHYEIVVMGTSDPRQVMDLLMAHSFLVM